MAMPASIPNERPSPRCSVPSNAVASATPSPIPRHMPSPAVILPGFLLFLLPAAAITTPPLPRPESPRKALHVQIPGSRSFQSVFFRSSGSSARSTVLARTHASRNCICAFVWNQCSPPSITVRAAPVRRAKASTVSRGMRASPLPYKIAVGTRHRIGCCRTSCKYRQDRVSPNSVLISPRCRSSGSVMPSPASSFRSAAPYPPPEKRTVPGPPGFHPTPAWRKTPRCCWQSPAPLFHPSGRL